jgi:hypothetical protein
LRAAGISATFSKNTPSNALFRILVGIGGVELRAASDARRICRGFPAAAAGMIDGERKKMLELPRTS